MAERETKRLRDLEAMRLREKEWKIRSWISVDEKKCFYIYL